MNGKKNDFLAVILNQPQFSIDDLQEYGITPDNTTIQSRDYYKNLPQVQEFFKNDKNEFDESAFNNFYQGALLTYNQYAQSEFENHIIETYDPYDWTAPIGATKRDTSATITFGNNPEKKSYGVSNLQEIGKSNFSIREIAQTNKVWDSKTETFLDWSPNDKGGFFKALNRPTLVLAQYEEDGTHEVNGRLFNHKKGDLRLHPETGEPFYETLGDREISGKDVLHYTDTITIDGEKWNKYDFFDSDGIDKSIGGTIMKTVVGVAPMLIPGVGTVFGTISAGAALTQLLPILGKSISNIINNEKETGFERTLNKIQNWGAQFGSSVSDNSRNKIATWENLGQLVKDVSLQLFQQQTIGKIPMKLFGKTEKSAELGRNLALAYMAGTSAQEAYSSFKEAGADDRTAGLGMLASTFAMWKLMNMDYFRDSLFKGTWLDESITKKPIQEAAQELADKAKFMAPSKAFTWMEAKLGSKVTKAAKAVTNASKKTFNPENVFINRALNEGIEETMEEVSQDAVKALFTAVDALGIPMTSDDSEPLNFNWSVGDMLTRYGVSFVGGAIGGPIFELHNRWQNQLNNNITKNMDRSSFSQLTYMLAQGKREEIDKYLDIYHKKGKFGSTNLSGIKYELVKGADGKYNIAYEESQNGDSQNDVIYNSLKNWVDYTDAIIKEEGLEVPILLSNHHGDPDDNKWLSAINTIGANASKLSDIQTITEDIVKTRMQIAAETESVSSNGDSSAQQQANAERINNNLKIQKLQAKLKDLREKRNQILNNELDGYYINQAKFALDINTSGLFADTEIDSYSLHRTGKVFSQLSPERQEEIREDFEIYKNYDAKLKIFKGFDVYLDASKQISPKLTAINESLKNVKPNELFTGSVKGSILFSLEKTLQQLEIIQNQLNNKEDKTQEETDELNRINSEIDRIKATQTYLENNPAELLLEETSENFPYFDRSLLTNYDPLNTEVYANGLLEYYKHLRDNQIVLKSNADLYYLMGNVVKGYKTNENQFKRLQTAFNNTFFDINQFIDKNSDEERSISGEDVLNELYDHEVDGKRYNLASNLKGEELPVEDLSFYNELDQLISRFNTALQYDAQEAIGIYQEILDLFNAHPIADRETQEQWESNPDSKQEYLNKVEQYVKAILPQINGKSIIDYLAEVDEIKSEVKESTFLDLLNDFIIDINGTPNPLLQVIQNEKRRLLSQKSAADYVIENTNVEKQLGEIQGFLNILEALINGSYSGLNESINRNSKIYNDLAVIDENTKNIIASEIKTLRSELDTLLLISQGNKERRLSEHQKIMANMRPKFIKNLKDYKEAFKKIGVNDIDALYDKYFADLSFDNIDIVNYKDYEKAFVDFETELGEQLRVKALANPKTFTEDLLEVLDKDGWKRKSTKLTSNQDEFVSTYDLDVYLTMLAAINSSEFYNKYKERIINNDDFDYAPTLGQEFAIRLNYAFNSNPELFNALNQAIHDKYTEDSLYIKHKPVLKNIVKILGSTGSGKTTAVDRGTYLMLKEDNIDFVFVGPEQTQVDRLVESIKPESPNPNFVNTKQGFLAKISKLNENNSSVAFESEYLDEAKKEKTFHYKNITPVSNIDKFGTNSKLVVFIDEISTWTEPELRLLSEWAAKRNVLVITTGDEIQNSAKLNHDGQISNSGLEDVEIISAPELNYTLRANSIAAIDNFNAIYSVLTQIKDKYKDNPDWEEAEADKETERLLTRGIDLKYFSSFYNDDEFNILSGIEIVNSDEDIKNWVNQFKSNLSTLKGNVLLVTDKVDKWTALDEPNLDIRTPQEAQGLEYDYVLIDIDWTKDGKYNQLRNFYTMTQRAKYGSVILNNGVKNSLNLINIKDELSKFRSEITKEQRDEYKKWRREALDKIVYTQPEFNSETPNNQQNSSQQPNGGSNEPNPTEPKPNEPKPNPPVNPNTPNNSGQSGGSLESQFESNDSKPNQSSEENAQQSKSDEESENQNESSEDSSESASSSIVSQNSQFETVIDESEDQDNVFGFANIDDVNDEDVRGGAKDWKSSNRDFINARFKNPSKYAGINNDEFFEWITTRMNAEQEMNNPNSFYNLLGLENFQNYVALVRQISGALLFDSSLNVNNFLNSLMFKEDKHYKKFESWLETFVSYQTKEDGESGNFLNDDKYELSVENIGDKRFVVMHFNYYGEHNEERPISLPIAIVHTNITGKLKNNHPFTLIRGTTKAEKTDPKTIASISSDKRLIFSEPHIISASPNGEVSKMDESIQNFIFGKYEDGKKVYSGNNGKAMMIVSDNPNDDTKSLTTNLQFDRDSNTGKPTYLYQNSNKYALVGVHQSTHPSTLIKAAISLYASMITTDAYWTVVSKEDRADIVSNRKSKEEILKKYLAECGINGIEEANKLLKYIPNYNRSEGQKPWRTFTNEDSNNWKEYFKYFGDKSRQVINWEVTSRLMTAVLNEYYNSEESLLTNETKNRIMNNLFTIINTKPYYSNQRKYLNADRVLLNLKTDSGHVRVLLDGNLNANGTTTYTAYLFSNGVINERIGKPIIVKNTEDIKDPLKNLIVQTMSELGMNYKTDFIPNKVSLSFITFRQSIDENGEILTDRGQVFYNPSNKVLYNVFKGIKDLSQIDDLVSKSGYFKEGLFCNDVAGKALQNSVFRKVNDDANSKVYSCDRNIQGSVFQCDLTSINEDTNDQTPDLQKTYYQALDLLKTALSENKIPFKLSDFRYVYDPDISVSEQINEIIDELNENLKTTATTFRYPQVIWTSNLFAIEYIYDKTNLIRNLLTKAALVNQELRQFLNENSIDDVEINPNIIETGNKNQIITYNIYLNNGNFGLKNQYDFIARKTGNTWEVREFLSHSSYIEAQKYITLAPFLGLTSEQYNIVKTYFDSIQDEDVDFTVMEAYQKLKNENQGNPILKEIDNRVNNYLLERLKNNEC